MFDASAVPSGIGNLETSIPLVVSAVTGQELVAFGELADDLVGCARLVMVLVPFAIFGASDTHKLWTTTRGRTRSRITSAFRWGR